MGSQADAQRPRPADHDPAFVAIKDGEWKTAGELEDVYPVVLEEDREAEFDEDEDRWWEL